MYTIPQMIDPSVPIGPDDTYNVEAQRFGEPVVPDFPLVGNLLATIPQAVLGGCTIMMFGSILFAGFQMMARCGFSQRNMIIVSLSLSVGLGFTSVTQLFSIFPQIVQTVFAENCVAVVFLLAVILNLVWVWFDLLFVEG